MARTFRILARARAPVSLLLSPCFFIFFRQTWLAKYQEYPCPYHITSRQGCVCIFLVMLQTTTEGDRAPASGRADEPWTPALSTASAAVRSSRSSPSPRPRCPAARTSHFLPTAAASVGPAHLACFKFQPSHLTVAQQQLSIPLRWSPLFLCDLLVNPKIWGIHATAPSAVGRRVSRYNCINIRLAGDCHQLLICCVIANSADRMLATSLEGCYKCQFIWYLTIIRSHVACGLEIPSHSPFTLAGNGGRSSPSHVQAQAQLCKHLLFMLELWALLPLHTKNDIS
jgi:hypothetical protein